MNRIAIDILLLAKSILSIKFKTQKQLQDYKKNHEVRDDTNLELEQSNKKRFEVVEPVKRIKPIKKLEHHKPDLRVKPIKPIKKIETDRPRR